MGTCTSKPQVVVPSYRPPSPPSVTSPRPHNPGRRKTAIPKTLKRMVWDTYIGAEKGEALCFCCHHVKIRQIEFHCGHVIAEAHGGATNVQNLRPVCPQCNLSMGTMNMDEFILKFMKPTK